MLEVGKKYYIIAHAYHHYLAEVVEVTPRQLKLGKCAKIHSCKRSWTEFFRDGAKDDTNFDTLPEGKILNSWLDAQPWPHAIPRK